MVITCSSSFTTTTNSSTTIFDTGNYSTKLLNIDSQSCTTSSSFPLPPKQLLIATPSESGHFPLVLFLHGYLLCNSFYSQLIQHISSHGFIVVAPQLYSVEGADATKEIKSTAEITNWLPEGLRRLLPSQVEPNFEKLALTGHSRGGKAAFALVLGKVANVSTKLKFSAENVGAGGLKQLLHKDWEHASVNLQPNKDKTIQLTDGKTALGASSPA